MRASEFIYESKRQINEGFWDSLKSGYRKILSFFDKAFGKKLEFGDEVAINLGDYIVPKNTPSEPETIEENPQRDVFDLTAIIGYYNEYLVAANLARSLENSGVDIDSNVDEGLYAYAEQYKKYILDNISKFRKPADIVQKEMKRAEEGAEIIAEKMRSEIADGFDLKFIEVDIDLTGKEAMGIGKEDIVVRVRKKDTKEVEDEIKASLKLYKSASGVNVYNATFASYLVTVLTGQDDPKTGKKAVEQFLSAHPEFKDEVEVVMNNLAEWNRIKTDLKKKKDPNYRKAANEFITKNRGYQKMRDLLFQEMWDYFYTGDNKAAINNRFLHRLGLDGAEDVYLLVGSDKQKMTAVSSRTSEEFKRLYDALKGEFNIRFEIPKSPDIVSCMMVIDDEDGTPLAKFTISFKEGGTFPHMWNMQDIVKGAKAAQKK